MRVDVRRGRRLDTIRRLRGAAFGLGALAVVVGVADTLAFDDAVVAAVVTPPSSATPTSEPPRVDRFSRVPITAAPAPAPTATPTTTEAPDDRPEPVRDRGTSTDVAVRSAGGGDGVRVVPPPAPGTATPPVDAPGGVVGGAPGDAPGGVAPDRPGVGGGGAGGTPPGGGTMGDGCEEAGDPARCEPDYPHPTGDDLIDALNEIRWDAAGCPALEPDEALDVAAQAWADALAEGVSFGYSPAAGIGYDENIAAGQVDVGAVVTGWMNTGAHRANIVNCTNVTVGTGTADGEGGPYWVATFGE